MKRFCFSIFGLMSLALVNALTALPASAQPPNPTQVRPQTQQFQGKITRMGSGQLIVQTRGNEQVTFHINPRTKLLMNNKVVQLTDLRVGSNVIIVALVEGDRQIAESVTVVTEEAAPPDEGTLLEGEIVRVIGSDQVVIRSVERKEVIVFVDRQTKFLFDNKPGQFTDLRPGAQIRVNFDLRDRRHMARHIVVPPRRK